MRVLVIGGTGSFSTRVTQKALERGHEVLVYSRGRRPLLDGLAVRWLHADRAALRAQEGELARFAPDVVVDSICFEPARAEDLVALFGAARRVVLNWHRPYACDKAVARLGHAPLGTPELMLEETVRHMLDAGLVKDAAEQPLDDALVELLLRHADELGACLARRAAAAR